MYKQCNKCLFVSKHNKDEKFICNKCHDSDQQACISYPVQAATKFLDQVAVSIYDLNDVSVQYDLYYFEGLETTSLFLCTAYECLLERLIFDYLISIKTPKTVSEILLGSIEGQEKRGNLFAKLTENGKSMKIILQKSNHSEFYSKLQKIIIARNSYIHGNPQAFKDSDLEAVDIKFVADLMVGVFVELNNCYVFRS